MSKSDVLFAILNIMSVGGIVAASIGAALIAHDEGGVWLMRLGSLATYAAFVIAWIW